MQHVSQTPTDPDFVQDPYRFYESARARGDVVFWDDYEMPVALSLAAVNAILKSRTMGREPPRTAASQPHLAAFRRVEAHSLLELEPPNHSRLRRLVQHAFSTRRIATMSLDISVLTYGLIETLPTRGAFDLLDDFAKPLPALVITRMMGLPDGDAPQLQAWSNAMVAMYQARRDRPIEDAANTAAADFEAYLRDAIAAKRNALSDDLLSDLITIDDAGDQLTEAEMISTCILLLNAGHEATVHTIANGVKTLLEHKTPLAALEPTAIESTVEEILRYDPPLHKFTRYVYEDTVISGHTLKAGTEVGCLLAASNRDPAVWPGARMFDTTRKVTKNASFGAGIHFCIGAALARLELQIALPALFTRSPHLALDGVPEYADTYHFHGLTRLMVTR
jgi:cytochrome P450